MSRCPTAPASERRDAPEDVQWSINPKEDVEATLTDAAEIARPRG